MFFAVIDNLGVIAVVLVHGVPPTVVGAVALEVFLGLCVAIHAHTAVLEIHERDRIGRRLRKGSLGECNRGDYSGTIPCENIEELHATPFAVLDLKIHYLKTSGSLGLKRPLCLLFFTKKRPEQVVLPFFSPNPAHIPPTTRKKGQLHNIFIHLCSKIPLWASFTDFGDLDPWLYLYFEALWHFA